MAFSNTDSPINTTDSKADGLEQKRSGIYAQELLTYIATGDALKQGQKIQFFYNVLNKLWDDNVRLSKNQKEIVFLKMKKLLNSVTFATKMFSQVALPTDAQLRVMLDYEYLELPAFSLKDLRSDGLQERSASVFHWAVRHGNHKVIDEAIALDKSRTHSILTRSPIGELADNWFGLNSDETPLSIAIANGDFSMVRKLIALGARPDDNAVLRASDLEDVSILMALLPSVCSANKYTGLLSLNAKKVVRT